MTCHPSQLRARIILQPERARVHPAPPEAEGAAGRDAADRVVQALAAELGDEAVVWRPGDGPDQLVYRDVPVLAWHGDQTLSLPRGLVPRLYRCLRRLGWQVAVHEAVRWSNRYRVDMSVVDEVEDVNGRQLFEGMIDRDRAQIECRGLRRALRLMEGLIRMYPSAGILIPMATRAGAWHVWRGLNHLGCVQHARGTWRREQRVVVCTYGASRSADPRQWQIVIAPEAEVLAGMEPQQAIGEILASGSPACCWALRRPGLRLSLREQLLIERLAGTVIWREGAERPPVRVALCPGPPHVDEHDGDERVLDRKRRTIWADEHRNRLLARLARAAVNNDEQALEGLGLPGTGLLDDLPEKPKVVVLVESAEHGRALLRMLPGWAVCWRRGRVCSRADGADERAGQIVTLTRAAEQGIEADVLIRAGGAWSMDCIDWPSRSYNEEVHEHLLIDLQDAHDPDARTDSHRRIRDYRAREWHVLFPGPEIPGNTARNQRGLRRQPGPRPGRTEKRPSRKRIRRPSERKGDTS